jgi:hypothetical protein
MLIKEKFILHMKFKKEIKMKTFKLILIVLLLSTYSCACKQYADIQKKHIETEKVRMQEQTKVVMAAYQMIINIMFPQKQVVVKVYL